MVGFCETHKQFGRQRGGVEVRPWRPAWFSPRRRLGGAGAAWRTSLSVICSVQSRDCHDIFESAWRAPLRNFVGGISHQNDITNTLCSTLHRIVALACTCACLRCVDSAQHTGSQKGSCVALRVNRESEVGSLEMLKGELGSEVTQAVQWHNVEKYQTL